MIAFFFFFFRRKFQILREIIGYRCDSDYYDWSWKERGDGNFDEDRWEPLFVSFVAANVL